MAASGSVCSKTFTPSADGKVIVTVSFNAQRTLGSDWGAGAYYKCYVTQGASTTYGDEFPLSSTRISYTVTAVFDVTGGTSAECGLFGGVSGASSADFHDALPTVEYIKL